MPLTSCPSGDPGSVSSPVTKALVACGPYTPSMVRPSLPLASYKLPQVQVLPRNTCWALPAWQLSLGLCGWVQGGTKDFHSENRLVPSWRRTRGPGQVLGSQKSLTRRSSYGWPAAPRPGRQAGQTCPGPRPTRSACAAMQHASCLPCACLRAPGHGTGQESQTGLP